MRAPVMMSCLGVIGLACVSLTSGAFADEVTTKTTTTKTADPPAVVVGAPAAAGAAVVEDNGGCSTKKVTKSTDEGDTSTKTKTNCD